MNAVLPRRTFLRTAATAGTLAGLGELDFLSALPRVSAAETTLEPRFVRFRPEIEPLVRLLEECPRERLLEEVAARIKRDTTYREVLAALLLAGVRNIQPRPVGFKFHAVLVVNSAHLASRNSAESDRWLPIFWALDQFKVSQLRDEREGDWTLRAVDESAIPPAESVRDVFVGALDGWDERAADTAAAGLARHATPQMCFDLFCRFGARDFRDLGHKAIYVANSWRTLQNIGWQHAEPVLRSLAYALLDHEGGNPAQRDAEADRPGRRNLARLAGLRPGWRHGKLDTEATRELRQTFRQGTADDASERVVELLARGVAPASLWDAVFAAAAEWLMRQPGIGTLHAVTAMNALHYAFQHASSDDTRAYMLLQAAAFIPLFRPRRIAATDAGSIEDIEPVATRSSGAAAVEEIFADVSRDRPLAAQKTLGWLAAARDVKPFIDAAQRLVFLKGTDSHDYKFSSAVLEDYHHLAPTVRDHYLAASTFWLKGSGSADNRLVARTRAAF